MCPAALHTASPMHALSGAVHFGQYIQFSGEMRSNGPLPRLGVGDTVVVSKFKSTPKLKPHAKPKARASRAGGAAEGRKPRKRRGASTSSSTQLQESGEEGGEASRRSGGNSHQHHHHQRQQQQQRHRTAEDDRAAELKKPRKYRDHGHAHRGEEDEEEEEDNGWGNRCVIC